MDPELEPFLSLFPPADLSDPPTSRKQLAELVASVPEPYTANLEIEDRAVPGEPDVPVRIYRPNQAQGAIIWLHGGGFVMGDLGTEHPWAAMLANGSGATVISVGYRLAPENPFPAANDDAYATLTWAAEYAAELRIDPERIAIGGHSSGAGIAAVAPSCAAQWRDEGAFHRVVRWKAPIESGEVEDEVEGGGPAVGAVLDVHQQGRVEDGVRVVAGFAGKYSWVVRIGWRNVARRVRRSSSVISEPPFGGNDAKWCGPLRAGGLAAEVHCSG
ncbi:alpha/beta hydrolase [Saccharopolyspora sp. NPDC002376]